MSNNLEVEREVDTLLLLCAVETDRAYLRETVDLALVDDTVWRVFMSRLLSPVPVCE